MKERQPFRSVGIVAKPHSPGSRAVVRRVASLLNRRGLRSLCDSGTARILGRTTAASGVIEELDAAGVKGLLSLAASDVGLGNVTNAAQVVLGPAASQTVTYGAAGVQTILKMAAGTRGATGSPIA